MSPADTALVMKVLAGAAILFGVGFIGNLLSFSNRFVNALVTALVFAVIYGALVYFIDRSTLPPELAKLSQQQWIQMIGMAAVLVFVIDLVANMISFSGRFSNAVMTAVVFAIVYGGVLYLTKIGRIAIPA
ncbi:MAG: hypothetical protein R3D27_11295 [Hyphomicrobiaceae bacterium]